MWRLWAKALGEKHGKTDSEADRIASIRTIIVGIYIITNLFIVAGILRHWNDEDATSSQVDHGNNVPDCSPNSKQQRELEQIRVSVICSGSCHGDHNILT
jgi:hypothetical protein